MQLSEKIELTMNLEIMKNCIRLYFYHALKKKNHRDCSPGHNSKITLSLNEHANLVSKGILLGLLAPIFNNRFYGFYDSQGSSYYHGILHSPNIGC
jgi:hypothetical protein